MVKMKLCSYCSCRLADYQETYAKEKAANVAQYQKALAEQVRIMILTNYRRIGSITTGRSI